jgi:hypothetical protein
MTTGTTPKPRSPRGSRSPPNNPNRLIAPNTPAEGIARPLDDSTRAQTPDARAEEEDVNTLPTKGPLGIRKNTIAAKKRAEKARQTRTQSPTASNETVKRARRARPEPGAMTISPDSSAQRKQMPTDAEETETESDEAIRRRCTSNSANEASSSSDQGPSQPKRPGGRLAAKRALAEEAYRKAYDAVPIKSQIVSRRDRPQGIGSVEGFQKYIKTRNEAEGVGTIKATRDAALSDLYANDPSARQLPVKEVIKLYENLNRNFNNPPITPSMVRHHKAEYKKRKETEPASNPRSNAKDQTKKKRKK